MKKRLVTLLSLMVCMALLFGACGGGSGGGGGGADVGGSAGSTGGSSGGGNVRLIIGSGPIGGAFYPIAGGIAAIINEHVDGVNVSVQVTAGGIENTRLVGTGEIDMGLSSAEQTYYAENNIDIFAGENLQLQAIGTLHSTVSQIVTLADSGITELADLEGKRVAIGEPGGGAELIAEQMEQFMGWGPDGWDTVYLPYDQAVDQLGDGLLDAAFVFSGTPAASVTSIASSKAINLVAISDESQQKWADAFDPLLFTFEAVPASTYNGMQYDAVCAVQRITLSVGDGLEEDLVYEITKAIYEHLDDLATYHASAESITRESAPAVIIDFHPGAERYFRENNLL